MRSTCGAIGLVTIATLSRTQAITGTLVFVPGDVIKCVVSALVVNTEARGLQDWECGGCTS